MKIEYLEINNSSIDIIRPLWEELRDHHTSKSTYFSEHISKGTFENRKGDLMNKVKNGQLKIFIAQDAIAKKLVGYCISSINHEMQGEIDSIYITNDVRGKGIGNVLMERTLEWFNEQGIDHVGISVIVGNEQALKFYEKYGFYPRTYVLKHRN